MTNYYDELGLDRSKRINEINADLSKLESTWKRREITNPEKATTMLALIIQARKAFASEAARRTYDKDLDNSQKKPEHIDSNKEKKESLKKWREQASSYYAGGQYDLAKVAVEKAISLSNVNGDDDSLFALAADIYKENSDLQTAMSYINRAIVAAPEISAYYLSKGLIYDRQASMAMQQRGYGNASHFRAEARKMFQMAETKAEQSGDLEIRARACGALAFSLYYQEPIDKQEGEKFANLAVKFGGDSWGNAEKVLSEAKRIRDEQEESRKKKIYDEAVNIAGAGTIKSLKAAIDKLQSLNGWNDCDKKIASYKEKIQDIEEKEKKDAILKEQERIKREKDLLRQKRNTKICSVVFAMIIAMTVGTAIITSNQKKLQQYNDAVVLLKAGKYDQAITEFNLLGSYKDSDERLEEARELKTEEDYKGAVGLFDSGDYEEAAYAFYALGNYKDSESRQEEAVSMMHYGAYADAENLLQLGKLYEAAIAFYALGDYQDAKKRCFECWAQLTERNTVSAGGQHSEGFTIGVKSNGTVVTTGNNQYGQCDVGNWTNIIAVAAGNHHSVGLRSDGTVVAVGENGRGQCDVSGWTNIVAISAYYDTVGLKADGTVVSTGGFDVSSWNRIIAIAVGPERFLGLRSDGTVVAVGGNKSEIAEITDWKQIVTICSDMNNSFGVRSDGTISGVGDSYRNWWMDWTGIIDVAHGCLNTVGLQSNGITIATDERFSGWKNILMVDGRSYHVVGLRKDGTVIAAGNNESGQCDVENWSDMMIPTLKRE